MADLTYGAEVVHDGNDAAITGGIKTYTDPNDSSRKGAVVAVITADGTVLRLGQALAAASLPVVLPVAQDGAKAEDAASGNGDVGHAVMAVRKATPANTSGTDGDYEFLQINAGRLWASATIDAALPAGTNNIGDVDVLTLPSGAYVSQPTVTRPANTTAYTAGDVVGGAITFTSVGPSGGHLLITSADLRIDVSAVPSGMTTFRLHLYDATPPSAIADNSAFDIPSGDRSAYLGYIDFAAPTDFGSTLYTLAPSPGLQVKLAAASTSLFGYLVTAGAFTPAANSEVYVPKLSGVAV